MHQASRREVSAFKSMAGGVVQSIQPSMCQFTQAANWKKATQQRPLGLED
jgi:hypothetical protein